jgi:hypothetical protein
MLTSRWVTLGPFVTVLPLLLAGVLPAAGEGALQMFVEKAVPGLATAPMAAVAAAAETQCMGLPEEVLNALAFAASFDELQVRDCGVPLGLGLESRHLKGRAKAAARFVVEVSAG